MSQRIVEKKLGIRPDYQYYTLHHGYYFHANFFRNKLAALDQMLNLNKNSRVLDLGAGAGIFELEYARKVKEIVALDYHQEALDFLNKQLKKEKIKNVTTITGDLLELDKVKKIGKFDLIILLDVLEHFHQKDVGKIINSCKKLLAPNGQICVTTPNYRSSWAVLERVWDKIGVVAKLEGEQHLLKFDKNLLVKVFKKAGFRVEKLTSLNLISFTIPSQNLSKKISSLEIYLPGTLGNLLLGVFKIN